MIKRSLAVAVLAMAALWAPTTALADGEPEAGQPCSKDELGISVTTDNGDILECKKINGQCQWVVVGEADPSTSPTPSADPTMSPTATTSPSPTPSADPTTSPTPTTSPSPTGDPTTSPTPTPTTSPSPTPTTDPDCDGDGDGTPCGTSPGDGSDDPGGTDDSANVPIDPAGSADSVGGLPVTGAALGALVAAGAIAAGGGGAAMYLSRKRHTR